MVAWWRKAHHLSSLESGKPHSVSVNMLCFIGAIIGVSSLFMPWVWTGEGSFRDSSSVYDLLLTPHDSQRLWWVQSSSVFLVVFISGTLLAFAFPAACALQSLGLTLYYSDWLGKESLFIDSQGLSLGFLTAVLSTAMVATSLIAPYGFNLDKSQGRWLRRAAAAFRFRSGVAAERALTFASPLSFLRAIQQEGRWVAVTITVIVLLSILVYVDPGDEGDTSSIEYVDGSITFSIGSTASYRFWPWTVLKVSDGSETVEWELREYSTTLPESESFEWTPPSLEAKNLSGLIVAPAIIDYGREGYVTQADQVTLTPLNGTAFSNDVEYTVYILDHFVVDASLTHVRASFELADSGVDSEFALIETQGFSPRIEYPFWITYLSVSALVTVSMLIYSLSVARLGRRKDRGPREVPPQ